MSNIHWFKGQISRTEREKLHGNKGAVIWLTGLSASGKSTIAYQVEKMLYDRKFSTYVFDGDNVRHGLCKDLGFSIEDRTENIRRIGEMSNLFVDAGIIAITAFISPNSKDRNKVKDLVGKDSFFEVYIKCPIDVCAKRDPKGLYQKAMAGLIPNFTGISSVYEAPENPDLVINSDEDDPLTSAQKIINLIEKYNII